MVVRKTPKPAEPLATVPRGAHHRAQKLVSKNVTTPTAPARRRPHHPRGVKNRPLDANPLASPQALGGKPQRTRPSTGRPAHSAWWQGKVPAGKAPQRLGAGLPDPDRASAMNAARCPSPHIAWHRTSACRGPRQQEHPASVDRRAPWPRRDPRASETLSCSRICCPEVCGNSTHRHIRSPASKSIGPHRRHAQQ